MKSKFMTFHELIDYCFKHYGFYIEDNDTDVVSLLKRLRIYLKQYDETILVRVSGEEILYQVVKSS